MDAFNNLLILLDSNLSGSWWFPALLIGTGIFFTFYLGFPQFKFFGNGWRIVSGKYDKSESKGEHLNLLNCWVWIIFLFKTVNFFYTLQLTKE